MTCNCETRVEKMLLERFKEHKPDWKNHSVEIKGYMTGLSDKMDVMRRMGTQFVCSGDAKNRDGDMKRKKLTQDIVFSFCPWCGVSTKPATAETPT